MSAASQPPMLLLFDSARDGLQTATALARFVAQTPARFAYSLNTESDASYH